MAKRSFQSVNDGSLGVSTVESILVQAEKREKEYDWLGAVESYTKALQTDLDNCTVP